MIPLHSHRPESLWHRRLRAAVVGLWLLVALPMLALPPEAAVICTMSCSLDGGSCCCKALGKRAPFSVTGEATYLSSHLPTSSPDLCSSWVVMVGGPQLPAPSPDAVAVVEAFDASMLALDEPAAPKSTSLSNPALPRPPPLFLR